MPFLYPKYIHRRNLTPPYFGNYRKYKPYLQKEFSCKCVYCMTPDTMKGYDFFGVDHYRPQKYFPNLVCEYLNLFYSCNRCNRLKRDFWPINNKNDIFVPNPCEHIMYKHLQFKDDTISPKSKAGEFTVELLNLNDAEIIEFRKCIINSKKALLYELNDLEKILQAIDEKINNSNDKKMKNLLREKEEILEDINNIHASINTLRGFRESIDTK